MNEKRTSVFENGLIWFGAAVSIAEIMTGIYFAPLGFKRGLAAIFIGHIIGCIMLFLAGTIGGTTRKSSMETVKSSFGYYGAIFFAVVNIIQLVGWTSIMIYDGSVACDNILSAGRGIWAVIIGGLISLWIIIGINNLGRLNKVAMSALFILSVVLCFKLFRNTVIQNAHIGNISFGAAVELSVAMPLSWLPLISDYTREAEKPVKASAVSAVTYGAVSCWMYIIGMAAAIFTAKSEISQIILQSGLGIAGLIVIVLSTVTTTFLDAYSAGVSGETVIPKVNSRWFSVVVTAVGTMGAMLFSMTDITGFLYFIGSVFAPMIAIQIADFYILKNNSNYKKINLKNIVIWFAGFIIYRLLMNVDIVLGRTLLDVVITIIICVAVAYMGKIKLRKV